MAETSFTEPRLQSAVGHWAARFVANGVNLTDYEEVTASLTRWEEWCGAWCARAEVHEALGHEALAQGRTLSAGEHLQRAGVYYHFAKFLFVNDLAQMNAAHARAVACRDAALPHLSPPGERIEIPFEGRTLYGILRKPINVLRPPLMLMACGLDSTKEETAAYEEPYLARGLATLVFDGPGQGEGEADFAIRGSYETVVSAVIDAISARQDIDLERIGLWGVSLGGYYAPRAAAFEPRVKACAAHGGPYNFGWAWDGLPELTREAFRVRARCPDDASAKQHAFSLSLEGVAERIRCPLYIMNGKRDRIVPWQDTERLAREAQGPVELLLIEDGNHIANNRAYRWRTHSADWMAGQLRAAN